MAAVSVLSISRSRWLLMAAILVAMAIAVHAGLGRSDLLCLAPALLLAATLLWRRYPGERVLVALAARRTTHVRRAEATRTASPRRFVLLARGGLLMGCSLAVRPPPRPLLAS